MPNSDADIIIINPNKKWRMSVDNMHSSVDYCGYEGKEVNGEIQLVIQRGEVLYTNGSFVGKKGNGKFIKRHKSSLIEN